MITTDTGGGGLEGLSVANIATVVILVKSVPKKERHTCREDWIRIFIPLLGIFS